MSGRAAEGSVSADPAASLRRKHLMQETFCGVTPATVPDVLTYGALLLGQLPEFKVAEVIAYSPLCWQPHPPASGLGGPSLKDPTKLANFSGCFKKTPVRL